MASHVAGGSTLALRLTRLLPSSIRRRCLGSTSRSLFPSYDQSLETHRRCLGRRASSSFPSYDRGLEVVGITAWSVGLPLHEGVYRWAGGKSVEVFDSTIVRVDTNDPAVYGIGENCPLGSNYLAQCAGGTRAGILELAPTLLGADPTRLNHINSLMDFHLVGHPNAKSALDMACWDILGKVANLPVCELLGGRYGENYSLYRAISQATPSEMARAVRTYLDEGYRKFQLKVGNCPHDDIDRIRAARAVLDEFSSQTGDHYPLICDANMGWLRHEAMQVCSGVRDLDVYIEMPCTTYEECRSVRDHTNLPFILDECLGDMNDIVKMLGDRAADVINLKLGKVGGLTKARMIRDVCVAAGIPMNIEDTWGGEVTQCAIAALAHSTPPKLLFCSTDFASYGPVTLANTTALRTDGKLAAPVSAGLGAEPLWEVLGDPVFEVKQP